tara:strand:- start:1065 stop:1538 length:474 start_codon:yes stop_codon:yes gene_type:complete
MKYSLLITIVVLLFSCSENASNHDANQNSSYDWTVDQKTENETVSWYITKDTVLSVSQDHMDIIKELNKGYHEYSPQIIFKKLSNDTLTIKLEHEERYSDQMGSFGAQQFLARLVYTLTEAELVNYVNLDIEMGSHGKPGVYNRLYFSSDSNYRIVE